MEQGERVRWPARLEGPEPTRDRGEPATLWRLDFGASVPCNRLILEVGTEAFSRPYRVEDADDPQNFRTVASGELAPPAEKPREPLMIDFAEISAHRLRIIFTDYRNPPLTLASVTGSAPARQIVFDRAGVTGHSLRLYFGNAKATAPHYDFETSVSRKLAITLVRCELGAVQPSPAYRPEPKPLTERAPWLVYVVLAVTVLTLALFLLNLVRGVNRGKSAT